MQKKNNYVNRISFSKIDSPIDIPDLLEIQKRSYMTFLQLDELPENRKNIGIQAAFKSIFPIFDFKETAILDFDSYSLGDWTCKCGYLEGIENSKPFCKKCGSLLSSEVRAGRHSVCPECVSMGTVEKKNCPRCGDQVRLKIKFSPEDCLDKGFDYSIPLKVKLRLALYAEDKKGKKVIKDVKEQDIFFGEIPFITERGTSTMELSPLRRTRQMSFGNPFQPYRNEADGKILLSYSNPHSAITSSAHDVSFLIENAGARKP